MALHLNFYHEIHREADARARDPFKLAALTAVGVALLFVGYYFYRSSSVKRVESGLSRARADWKRLEPAQKEAKKREAELVLQQKNNQLIVERLQGRFYWAPLLARVAAATPPTVQITGLQGALQSSQGGARPSVSVLLSGIAAGAQPRAEAEQFRQALEKETSTLVGEGEGEGGASVTFDGTHSLEDTGATVEWQGQALATTRYKLRVAFQPRPVKKEEPAKPAQADTKNTR